MYKSVHEGKYKLHYKCEDPIITHLFFMEDLIAFMGGDIGTLIVFKENMRVFRNCSAFNVNIDKSQICYCDMEQKQWKSI